MLFVQSSQYKSVSANPIKICISQKQSYLCNFRGFNRPYDGNNDNKQ